MKLYFRWCGIALAFGLSSAGAATLSGLSAQHCAWLAGVGLVRNQEFVFERQQELLLQGTSDTLAERIRGFLGEKQNEFGNQVDHIGTRSRAVRCRAVRHAFPAPVTW